jgi:hypothetical protein
MIAEIMKKYLNVLLSLLLTTGLVACGDSGEGNVIAVQHWQEADIRVETHPNPPLAGMSEIVIIITGPHGRPIPNLTVSIRGSDSSAWVQAIQDGMIGVYRRAVDIGDANPAVLQVRLQQGTQEKILLYPLKLASN